MRPSLEIYNNNTNSDSLLLKTSETKYNGGLGAVRFFYERRPLMERFLQDQSGTVLEAKEVNHTHVVLAVMRYPEIKHVYRKEFIESAIKQGLLSPAKEGSHD
jgi:hypothetical protein